MYPFIGKLLNQWVSDRLRLESGEGPAPPGWIWSSITINGGFASKAHKDRNNFGPSIIRAFGTATGGDLYYWPEDTSKKVKLNINDSSTLMSFDGTRLHETEEISSGDRYSVIFFTTSSAWESPSQTRSHLCGLGFRPPNE